jgi:hypothetical protein
MDACANAKDAAAVHTASMRESRVRNRSHDPAAKPQVNAVIAVAEGVGFEPTDHGWDHDQRFSSQHSNSSRTCDDVPDLAVVPVMSPRRIAHPP